MVFRACIIKGKLFLKTMIRISFLNPLFIFMGEKVGLIVFLTILSIILYFQKKDKIIPFWISIISTGIISTLIKHLIGRPRPDISSLIIKTSPSFPSTHAAIATAGFFFFIKLKPLPKMIALVLSLIVASTGYYNGVHYLSDIFAGIFLGILISYLTEKWWPKIKNRFLSKITI